jgi:hypothetical protein
MTQKSKRVQAILRGSNKKYFEQIKQRFGGSDANTMRTIIKEHKTLKGEKGDT